MNKSWYDKAGDDYLYRQSQDKKTLTKYPARSYAINVSKTLRDFFIPNNRRLYF